MIEEFNKWDWILLATVVSFIHGASFFWGKLRRRQIRESEARKRHEASEEA